MDVKDLISSKMLLSRSEKPRSVTFVSSRCKEFSLGISGIDLAIALI